MLTYDAIYTRQSVDRVDSISVESQVEFCKREVVGNKHKVYTDKGYSGKNIDRPQFQELLSDIKAGKVRKVIVYRLDRISRSVLDFANIIDIFQKHRVDFVSTMEKFDTGTPIGKAMLMIVMIFAQLERETIQQRVIDAYHSRSLRGFYMGGRIPLGFKLQETSIDGIRTKMYGEVPSEADTVRLICQMYSLPHISFGDIVKYLDDNNIRKRDGRAFTRGSIRDIVINPAYVRADYAVYEFFKAQGANIVNRPEDFIGTNGAYLYSGDEPKRKTISLSGHTLVLAPHEGLVESAIWLKCRKKCLTNTRIAKPLKAKQTWLAGKIKCGTCGYALTAKVYKCKTKEDNRYYLCTHKYSSGACDFGSLDADIVDAMVLEEMKTKLQEFSTLSQQTVKSTHLQIIKLKSRIEAIDKEIAGLLDKISSASPTVMEYINNRIAALDEEKKGLYAEIVLAQDTETSIPEITGYMNHWDKLTIEDKMAVVDILIDHIVASPNSLEITWKI